MGGERRSDVLTFLHGSLARSKKLAAELPVVHQLAAADERRRLVRLFQQFQRIKAAFAVRWPLEDDAGMPLLLVDDLFATGQRVRPGCPDEADEQGLSQNPGDKRANDETRADHGGRYER